MHNREDQSHSFSGELSLNGSGVGTFVFPRGWLLEIITITSGSYGYISDGVEVRTGTKHFGAFYPQFALISPAIDRVKGWCRGVASASCRDWLPSSAIVFETDFVGDLLSVTDAEEVLRGGRAFQSVDVNTCPSRIASDTKRLIDENFMIYPSMSKIAHRLGVSAEHLSREFKRNYTITPSNYLHQLRVAEATSRLAAGEPIIDIAMDVGYNDLSRFYKQFRKKTQMSPAACRSVLEERQPQASKNAKTGKVKE